MIKHISLLIISLFSWALLFSQETTYGGTKEDLVKKAGALGSLVIIPFENRMYLSDADAPIGRETGLKPGELQIKFRNSLVETLEMEMQKDWDLIQFYDPTRLNENESLEYIHHSLRYQFDPVSDKVLLANDTTLDKKDLKKKNKSKKQEEGIVNGQVVSRVDDTERFMNMYIQNDSLMAFLDSNLKSDYYLFINEFDIRYHVSDPSKIASGGLTYRLKSHFTCIDDKGKVLVAGVTTSDVNAGTQNIYEIIVQSIPELSGKMAKMVRSFKLEENP